MPKLTELSKLGFGPKSQVWLSLQSPEADRPFSQRQEEELSSAKCDFSYSESEPSLLHQYNTGPWFVLKENSILFMNFFDIQSATHTQKEREREWERERERYIMLKRGRVWVRVWNKEREGGNMYRKLQLSKIAREGEWKSVWGSERDGGM